MPRLRQRTIIGAAGREPFFDLCRRTPHQRLHEGPRWSCLRLRRASMIERPQRARGDTAPAAQGIGPEAQSSKEARERVRREHEEHHDRDACNQQQPQCRIAVAVPSRRAQQRKDGFRLIGRANLWKGWRCLPQRLHVDRGAWRWRHYWPGRESRVNDVGVGCNRAGSRRCHPAWCNICGQRTAVWNRDNSSWKVHHVRHQSRRPTVRPPKDAWPDTHCGWCWH
mmetsp:Transcript_50135/g.140558  ORF Transcript_50135/g.140558 Transcript_50135/m.140558 type:complete len:224 (+) Transcript_50135:615-1286(+)